MADAPPPTAARRLQTLTPLALGILAWAWFEWRSSELHGHGLGPVRWILIALAVLLSFLPPVSRGVITTFNRLRFPSPRTVEWTTLAIAVGATAYFVFTAFHQDRDLFPKTHDEGSYVIGVRMLARGRLWMPPHPLADFFDTFYVLVRPVYASLYFPGTALLYAPTDWLQWPTWLMPVVAAGAVVGLLYRIVTELVDGAAGILVALLMVSLSWYRMLSVLVFAQVPLLLFGLLLVWAWLRWRRSPGSGAGWALVMGAFAGWAAIIRPLDALCYAIPVGAGVLYDLFVRFSAPEGRQALAHGVSRRNTGAASTLPSSPAPEGRKNRGQGGASGRAGTPADSYAPAGAGEGGTETKEGGGLPSPRLAPWAKVLRHPGAEIHSDRIGRRVGGGGSGVWFRFLAPLLILLGALPFLSLQLYFNHSVTGRWTETPYTHYLERDQPRTSLGFHAYDPSMNPQSTLQQKRDYYRAFMLPYIREHQLATFLQSWATKYLPMLVDTTLPARLLVVFVPLGVLRLTDPRRKVLWATLPLFVAGYMLNTFFLEHYAAAVIPAVLLSVVLGQRVLADAFPRFRETVGTAGVLVIVVVSLTSLYEFNPVATALDRPDRKHMHEIDDETFHSALLRFAHDLDALVEKPAVVLFKYSPGQNVIEEPVYNTDVAWPDDAPVIRAHDLGERNREIFRYYAEKQPDRMFYQFDRATGKLTPLGTARDLAAR